jgi:hypothetical protein
MFEQKHLMQSQEVKTIFQTCPIICSLKISRYHYKNPMISPSHHGTSAYPSGKWLHEGIKPAMFLHGGGKIMGIEMTKGRYDDG